MVDCIDWLPHIEPALQSQDEHHSVVVYTSFLTQDFIFFFWERERECMHMQVGAAADGENLKQTSPEHRGWQAAQSDNAEIMTWAETKSQMLK